MQGEINDYQSEPSSSPLAIRDELNFELLHNLVLELTRLGIEVKNLKMRVESLSTRLDFDERRARALEGVVQYKPGAAGAALPQGGDEGRRGRGDGDGRRGPRRQAPPPPPWTSARRRARAAGALPAAMPRTVTSGPPDRTRGRTLSRHRPNAETARRTAWRRPTDTDQ